MTDTKRPTSPGRRRDPRPVLPRARPRLRLAGRLHGHRRVHRARRARELRLRHAQAEPDARPAALPAPPPAHDAERDGRAQVPLLHADVHRAPVDPAPHGQRERVLGALLADADALLHADAEQLQTQSKQEQPGAQRARRSRATCTPRPCAAGARSARASRERLRVDDGRGHRARARAHRPAAVDVHAVVLEDRSAQPPALPDAARRRARAVGDPGVRARHGRHAEARRAAAATRPGSTTTSAARRLSRMELDAIRALVARRRATGLRAAGGALGKEALLDARPVEARDRGAARQARAAARRARLRARRRATPSPAEHFAARFADAVPKADRAPASPAEG